MTISINEILAKGSIRKFLLTLITTSISGIIPFALKGAFFMGPDTSPIGSFISITLMGGFILAIFLLASGLILFAFLFILITKKFLAPKINFFIFWCIIGGIGGLIIPIIMCESGLIYSVSQCKSDINSMLSIICAMVSGIVSAWILHPIYFRNITKFDPEDTVYTTIDSSLYS
jgi:hypothetical protein